MRIIFAKMARKDGTLRLFVAIYPPEPLIQRWAELVHGLDLPPHRPTPNDQIHMTLQFIGDCAVRDLERTIESVERATSGLEPFALQPRELITLPERGPARLIAMETDAPPTLLELQRRLAMRLARKVRKNPSKKFRPHLTLCRFKPPVQIGSLPDSPAGKDERESFDVRELHLMKSTLKPAGAEHETVQTLTLET